MTERKSTSGAIARLLRRQSIADPNRGTNKIRKGASSARRMEPILVKKIKAATTVGISMAALPPTGIAGKAQNEAKLSNNACSRSLEDPRGEFKDFLPTGPLG